MPTFAARHPELVPSALRSLVDMAAEFHHDTAASGTAGADDDDPAQAVPPRAVDAAHAQDDASEHAEVHRVS
jgi:hypothetical protein